MPLLNLLEKGNRAADFSGIEGVAGDTDYDSSSGGLSTGDNSNFQGTSSYGGDDQGPGSSGSDANALSAIAQLASSQLAGQPASAATAQLFQSLMNLKANYLQNGSNFAQPDFNTPWTPVTSNSGNNQADGASWSSGNTLGPSKSLVS